MPGEEQLEWYNSDKVPKQVAFQMYSDKFLYQSRPIVTALHIQSCGSTVGPRSIIIQTASKGDKTFRTIQVSINVNAQEAVGSSKTIFLLKDSTFNLEGRSMFVLTSLNTIYWQIFQQKRNFVEYKKSTTRHPTP